MRFDFAFFSHVAESRFDRLEGDLSLPAVTAGQGWDEFSPGDYSIARHTDEACACGKEHDYSLDSPLVQPLQSALTVYQAGGPQFATDPRVFADEIPANTSTSATLAVGGSVVSDVDTVGDRDWFRIELVAGQRYQFDLIGSGAPPLSDPLLNLRDSAGNQIASNDDGIPGTLNSRITFTASYTGSYFLDAGSFSSSTQAGTAGGYTLSAASAGQLIERTPDGIANFLTNEYWTPRRWAPGSAITYNVEGLSAGAQVLAERALQEWASLTSLSFVRTTNTAQMTFQNTGSGAYASSTTSGTDAQGFAIITGGTINVNATWNSSNLALDSYTYQTFLHEVGHAIGLGHGGPYNSTADYTIDNVYLNDTWASTVMSYFDQSEAGYGSFRFVLGPQNADIIAVQNLYGAEASGTRTGNTVYGFNSTETDVNNWAQFTVTQSEGTYQRPPSYAIYDTGGTDTIDLSGYASVQLLNLNPETYSSLGFRPLADQPHYRNVVSIARGTIIENAIGGSGNDTITGNSANNRITLGAGIDIYAMLSNGGNDTITDFSVTQDFIDLTNLSLAQQQAAIASVRASGADTIIDIAGGTLTLTGVSYLSVTASRFLVPISGTSNNDVLSGTNGIDTIFALDGDDTLIGSNNDDRLNGGNGNDVLYGGGGSNIFEGGAGNDVFVSDSISDTLIGGEGNDTYILNIGGTFISEVGSSTNDIVYSFRSLTLPGGIETGVMFAPGSTLTGNDLNNLLIGNSGTTTIRGGAGNDTIYGVGGFNGLNGEAGNDVLVSGTGTDTMTGGTGDDVYIIGAGDNVTEASNSGTDTVYVVGGSYTLSGNVEIGVAIGATSVIGNSIGNTLIGDGGNNALSGLDGSDFLVGGAGDDFIQGGAGLDTLQGNTGQDVFHYTAGSDMGDIIQDWVEADDSFSFSAAAFGFTAGQTLVAGTNFFASTAPTATGSGPSFLWDSDDTLLYFDSDGAGAIAPLLVADLQAFTNVTVLDFLFVAAAELPGEDVPDAERPAYDPDVMADLPPGTVDLGAELPQIQDWMFL